MSLVDFQRRLAGRLLVWSILSSLVGAVILAAGRPPAEHAFGVQTLAWGVIDLAVAAVVLGRARHGAGTAISPDRLQRLLRTSAVLDVLFLVIGLGLALLPGTDRPDLRGHGWGVSLQAGFLLLLDWVHANGVPFEGGLLALGAFAGEEHRPFCWEGGEPAALLVHGFPGTPAEMRPLGEALRDEGWTVQGLLLPGLGNQIDSLPQRRYGEWVAAVRRALLAMGAHHRPVLLVGYSLGGALAIAAASAEHTDGLVLIAPFTMQESGWRSALRRASCPLVPRYVQPFQWLRLDDQGARKFIRGLLPEVDLDDPAVRLRLEQTRVPTVILEQVFAAGFGAWTLAGSVVTRSLVIAGAQDPVVSPAQARRLVARLGRAPAYAEFPGGHDLTRIEHPSWPDVRASVLEFAQEASRARQP